MQVIKEVWRRRAETICWILLVLASMALIAIGLAGTLFFLWAPEPAMLEKARVGNRYVFAGCTLSIAAAVWSGAQDYRVWVTICVGLPGILVGWAALDDPHSLLRHLAAVVSYPMALAALAEVIRGQWPPA